jgi:acyl carrier protein
MLGRYIVENLLDEELADGVDPLASDAVDSLGLEQLALFIGDEFGVTIRDADMSSRNFASVQRLASFVEEKQRGAA